MAIVVNCQAVVAQEANDGALVPVEVDAVQRGGEHLGERADLHGCCRFAIGASQ